MKKPLLSELTLREKIGQTAMGRPGNRDFLEPEMESIMNEIGMKC